MKKVISQLHRRWRHWLATSRPTFSVNQCQVMVRVGQGTGMHMVLSGVFLTVTASFALVFGVVLPWTLGYALTWLFSGFVMARAANWLDDKTLKAR